MATTRVALHWKRLVEAVNDGIFESDDPSMPFMYVHQRNAFVSDRRMLRDIGSARAHDDPFLLIGKMGTGKNLFIELVARGGATSKPRSCIDENIDGHPGEPQMVEHFFGPRGVVDANRDALIHFDLLQNAVEWPSFLQKLHAIARYGTLFRTDGEVIPVSIRVVAGATVELGPFVAVDEASEFGYFYHLVATSPVMRTTPLERQLRRLPDLLSERLASHVLSRPGVGEREVEALTSIASEEIAALGAHSWPGEFPELASFVSQAIARQSWSVGIREAIPARVFIIWSKHHAAEAAEFNRLLNSAGVPTWFSPNSIEAGEWWPQISSALGAVQHIVICLSRRVFDVDVEGVNRRELEIALERSREINWEFLFPVVLDATTPDGLHPETASQKKLLEMLKPFQWFWVDVKRPGDDFARFLDELRSQMNRLQEARLATAEDRPT